MPGGPEMEHPKGQREKAPEQSGNVRFSGFVEGWWCYLHEIVTSARALLPEGSLVTSKDALKFHA